MGVKALGYVVVETAQPGKWDEFLTQVAVVMRARWRCRRGMLELDIVLQRFIDNDYKKLSTQQLQQFERLLDLPDQDLWSLITGRQVTSDENLSTVLNLLQKN